MKRTPSRSTRKPKLKPKSKSISGKRIRRTQNNTSSYTCKQTRTRKPSLPLAHAFFLGGGCGCGGNAVHLPQQGGYRVNKIRTNVRSGTMRGGGTGVGSVMGGECGTPSFDGLQISKFYGLNTFQNDPGYFTVDSRNV